jgi:hypothetical protein
MDIPIDVKFVSQEKKWNQIQKKNVRFVWLLNLYKISIKEKMENLGVLQRVNHVTIKKRKIGKNQINFPFWKKEDYTEKREVK